MKKNFTTYDEFRDELAKIKRLDLREKQPIEKEIKLFCDLINVFQRVGNLEFTDNQIDETVIRLHGLGITTLHTYYKVRHTKPNLDITKAFDYKGSVELPLLNFSELAYGTEKDFKNSIMLLTAQEGIVNKWLEVNKNFAQETIQE